MFFYQLVIVIVMPSTHIHTHRSARSCTAYDYFGWADAASSAAEASLPPSVSLDSFQHRVLVLPSWISTWAGCAWAGLGTVGPAYTPPSGGYGYGYVWISGEHSSHINAYFHELSHNLYLGELVTFTIVFYV